MTERGSWLARQPVWRRRLLGGLTAYVVLLLVLGALGLAPSTSLFAAFFVAAVSVLAFVADRWGDTQPDLWPAPSPSTVGLGRGADHQAAALARDLHAQLCVVVADKVARRHGRDVLADPHAARELLPPDLAELVLGPPDERRLTEPVSLSHLLDRIESL